MDAKTTNAITALELQKSKISNLQSFDDGTWKTHTLSYIETFFGKPSVEYDYFSKLHLFVGATNGYTDYSQQVIKQMTDAKKVIALQFIDNSIDTLRHKGVYRKPMPFLEFLHSHWAITSFIIVSLVGVSYLLGQLSVPKSTEDLRTKYDTLQNKYQHLTDSIIFINRGSTHNKTQIDTAK